MSALRRPRRPLQGLPPEVAVLAAVSFSVALGFGIVAPAIPLFAKEFGVSDLAAGSVVSVFALLRFGSAPLAGRLVDRLGERVVLASGIGIVGVSSLLAGFAQSFGQLLALRGAGGIGSSMFTVSAFSLLLRVVGPAQRGRASGAFQAGFLVGGITGPVFGGPLTDWSLRAPFFVYAVTLLLAGTVATVFLARAALQEREAAAGSDHPPTPLRVALRNRAYLASLTSAFANGWAIFGVRSSLVPLLVVEGLRLSPSWTGAGFAVSAVVQAMVLLPAGRMVDTRGRRPALRTGAALSVAAALVLALTASGAAFLLAMALYGAGAALLGVATAAAVGDVIGGRGGSAVAAFQMAGDLGAFVGPLVAGQLSDSSGFPAAFLATAAVASVALASTLVMPETRRPAPDPAPTDRPADGQ